MSMSKSKKESREVREPTEADVRREMENLFVEKRETLERAHKLAVEAFGGSVTFEVLSGVAVLIEDGVEEATVVPVVQNAVEVARRFGLSDPEDVLSVAEILLDDIDHGEERLAEAAAMAKRLTSADDVLDFYYSIYDVDEDTVRDLLKGD